MEPRLLIAYGLIIAMGVAILGAMLFSMHRKRAARLRERRYRDRMRSRTPR